MRKRIAWHVAVVGAAVLLLSGCVTGPRAVPTPTPTQPAPSLALAVERPLTTMNAQAAGGSSEIAALTSTGFNSFDKHLRIVRNTRFGTYRKLSDDPLTVQYTVKPGVRWSDGVQMGAADLLLARAASLSRNNAGAVDFGSVDAGGPLDGVTRTPVVSDDDRSVTLVYDRPNVDWELALEPGLPAHVVYALSGLGRETGQRAQHALEAVLAGGNTSKLQRIARAWRTGFDLHGLPRDRRLLVTDGPYAVTDLVEGQYAVLTTRPGYTAGPRPASPKLIARFLPDPAARNDALQNGQVQVITGAATTNELAALRRVRGVHRSTFPTSAFEHLDLTFGNRGPFDSASYRGNTAAALAVRRAFLMTVPRQRMLDTLVRPVQPHARLDDSALLLPGQAGYDESVRRNGSAGYRDVDVAGARRLLAAAGLRAPVRVRLAYATDDPRRVAEFRLIRASAARAGFDVVGVGRTAAAFFDPRTGVGTGGYRYDACLFAYRLNSPAVLQSEPNTRSGSPENYQRFADPAVDTLWNRARTAPDIASAVPIQQAIDRVLIGDAATLPLYQIPSLAAWNDSVSGVSGAPYPPGILSGATRWIRRM